MSVRFETDSAGTMEVPAKSYWGSQTARALVHFNIGTATMPLPLIHALGLIKKAAAQVNSELGLLDAYRARLIVKAAEEIIEGRHNDQFPLSIWQSGSGTQTNMNVNEVIANRAAEMSGKPLGSKDPVHPNDHVNLSQSTNDSFPTAMHIAVAKELTTNLLPAIATLRSVINDKSGEFHSVIKVGRTHLQDATPITVGQEFSGWSALLSHDEWVLKQTLEGVYQVAQGGTAVGTGINSHPEFAAKVAQRIAELTGLPFRSHPNKFAALSGHAELLSVSAAMRGLAATLLKVANDVRLLGSGPRCGIGELQLPENEPGSSIMPGKVNPTQCEALSMVAIQVYGNDAAIAFAASQGQLQLNVYKPLIIHNLLNSISLLSDTSHSFTTHCMTGLRLNQDTIGRHLNRSLMLVTALAPKVGYDRAAQIAKTAYYQNINLRDASIASGFLTAIEFDEIVKPGDMIEPNR